MEFIDLKTQYQRNQAAINARMAAVLEHGRYIMGPEVAELEARLADFAGVKHALGCANGTDAIQLALMAADIGPGDAVFVPTFTFSATAEPVALLGATPVFVDVDPDTYNICATSLAEAIDTIRQQGALRPAAVIPVDLFGAPANYAQLEALCSDNALTLIEDAAQSFGASHHGRRCGAFGDMATTSFFPAKPLGCYGDGGAVFTNDDALADRIRSLRVHGKGSHKYENIRVGINSRLDTLQAAVLLCKLDVFEMELAERDRVRRHYDDLLGEHFVLQKHADGATTSVAQYCIQPNNGTRDMYLDALKSAGIPTAIYYPVPLHAAPAYANNSSMPVSCSVSELAAGKIFSVPMHPYLESNEIHAIAAVLNETALAAKQVA